MFKNLFSFSPNLGIAMGTVLFLVIVGSAYFFAYLPNNKKELEEKQFRCLQNAEHNIQEKIDNSLALLKNLVRNYEKPAAGRSSNDIITYIRNYPSKDLRLSIYPVSLPDKSARTDTTVTFNQDSLSIEIKAKNAKFGITYTFKQFIDPLLPRDIFDKYMVFSASNVIYQTFPSGITQVADSLINNKSTSSNGPAKDIFLSGTAYKLFSQQVNLKTQSPITLVGLLSKDHYGELKNKLPEQTVLFLLLLAIAGILALPWIKLYQMGGKDRMTASDGLFSLTVPMLLMSILFFAFLSYNISFSFGPIAPQKITRDMADRIKRSFGREIDSTYDVLKRAAVIYRQNPISTDDTLAHVKLRATTKGFLVNQIFQLNYQGIEIRNWTPGVVSAPPGDYANRQYFIRLKNRKPFYLHRDRHKPFYIDQLTSWTTASFTTVMSVPEPGQNPPYTAISFNVKSLNRAVLTPGLIYTIIDANGKVLYHSDSTKQLNENLFEEFSEHQTLKGAVDAHNDKVFETKYSGKQYNVYVSPFSGLPYYLITLEEKSYTSVREINNFVFSFSMLFAFFILLAVELLIVFMVSVKQSSYKKHYFDLSWVGPNEKFHEQYKVALYGNLATVFLLIVWMARMKVSPFLECLFILVTASCLSFLFLNILYFDTYRKEKNSERWKLKRNAVIALSTLLLFFNIIAFILTTVEALLFFELTLITVLAAIRFLFERTSFERQAETANKGDFSRSFSLMTFTRLIITNGLPVILFYISVSNYDIKLVTRYRHMHFTKNILEQNPLDTAILQQANVYLDSVWIRSGTFVSEVPQFSVSPEEQSASRVFRLFTISNDDLLPGIKALDHTPEDKSWTYSSLFMPGRGATYYQLADHKFLELQSASLRYNLPGITFDRYWYKGVAYWLLFLSALAGFWLMLHHVLRRLFALNLPSAIYWEELDKMILVNDELNSLVFLIGAPGSGKLTGLAKLIANKDLRGMGGVEITIDQNAAGVNGYIADMILIPNNVVTTGVTDSWLDMKTEALQAKYKLVIVNHFEYDIKNQVSNRLKLDFLEELLQKNNCKVIIVSTVHPINFLDSLNQQQADITEGTDRSPEHDLERWHVLLGHFKIVVQKLNSASLSLAPEDPKWKQILNYETRSGHFLNRMQRPILDRLDKEDIKKDNLNGEALSLKLGIISHYFYMYMWQALTKEEKFLLYDLAEDGLVNPFDDYNLILLISKGLVIRENGQLKLFNHGFRQFILTAIGNSEAIQIQKQIKDSGNWNRLKIPLTLLIMALLAFLFTSQKEVYTSVLKYVTIVTAGVPIILKLFSGLGSSDNKVS